jgi:peptidylprolyl isomerase domain and WD repeat-containing protein 1
MASNGSESPSKTKRSRDEMEAEDCVTAPTAQTNDGTVMIAQCDMRNS